MERKGGNTTVMVEADEVRAALSRAKVTTEEEKALRMRHGVTVEKTEALPSAAGGNAELADELLLIEMQLMKAWRRRAAEMMKSAKPRNVMKEKIIRGLRKKH